MPPEEAAPPEEKKPDSTLEIYGFAMTDMVFDFGHIGNPNWSDTLRPTKLPSFEDEFGSGPRTAFGVRQSRFGVKYKLPTTDFGDFTTKFEFELFGVGPDEGQTTFRLRHAYGQLGQFGAGQTWSPFMDEDVFPNSVEYWGPPGMVFFRNVQARWMPIQGDTRLTLAVERPGASADRGDYAERVELEGVVPRFPAPDLSGEFRFGGPWGYVELAGILRWMEWDDLNDDDIDVSGDAFGWGLNLSSGIKFGEKNVIKLQAVYGQGIANYMNDSTADVAIDTDGGDIEGAPLPLFGGVAFVDMYWNDRLSSTAGYSHIFMDNTDGQAANAFRIGNYALANLMFYPVPELMLGPEAQWGRRKNFEDGWDVNDYRIQVSLKYSFSKEFGGGK